MSEYRGRKYLPRDKLPNGAKLWTRKESAKRSVVPKKTHELAYPAGHFDSSDQLPEDQKVGFRPGDLVWWVGPVRKEQRRSHGTYCFEIEGYTAVPFLVVSCAPGGTAVFQGPNELRMTHPFESWRAFDKEETLHPDLYFQKKKHPVWCDEGLKVIGWMFHQSGGSFLR
jgi:hypothetical protein